MKMSGSVALLLTLGIVASVSAMDEKAKDPQAKTETGTEAGTIAGAWACVQNLPNGLQRPFEMQLNQHGETLKGAVLDSDGTVVASVTGSRTADGFKLLISTDGELYEATAAVKGGKVTGTWTMGDVKGTWEGTRKAN